MASKKGLPKPAQRAKTGGDAMANATRGRARVFKDKRKEQSRNACRGKVRQED